VVIVARMAAYKLIRILNRMPWSRVCLVNLLTAVPFYMLSIL